MKEVEPGVWINDELHFEVSEEDQKMIDKTNEETRRILKDFLTELKKCGRVPLKITIFDVQ